MAQAFIIMQIGQTELDLMCKQAIVPAIEECGMSAKRVDKHNEGGLLKSEIIAFIEESDIIIADLTNERPNCYLEIGYTMGVGKNQNLILTAREDHYTGSPNHIQGGPKIHFDLAGYDILFWNPKDLESLRQELEKRIQRRRLLLTRAETVDDEIWQSDWYQKHRDHARETLQDAGFRGALEIAFSIIGDKPNKEQRELLEAAEQAQIHSFGWPIGVAPKDAKLAPKPRADGIVAEIRIEDFQVDRYSKNSYDYWSLRNNGDFYLLKTTWIQLRSATAGE